MSVHYKTNGESRTDSASLVAEAPVISPSFVGASERIGGNLRHCNEMIEDKEGLRNARAVVFLVLWYIFSVLTLFLNKYILDTLHVEANLLSASQLLMTVIVSFVQTYWPCGMYKPAKRRGTPLKPFWNVVIVGLTRYGTVALGLVALKYVTVSFTETVKSSAPLFTVILTRLLFGEVSGLYVQLSLLPIMLGLALCSAYDLSFNLLGFMASMATNIAECLQNIYSKNLISNPEYKYTPAELLCYTSLASIACQLPVALLMISGKQFVEVLDLHIQAYLILNGLFFHFQLITAYALMEYISNVTYSVSNTVKRALMIWISIPFFNTPVTLLSGLGTAIITAGVLLYTKARDYDMKSKQLIKI